MTRIQNLSLKVKIQLIILGAIAALTLVGLVSIFFISRAYQKVLYQTISAPLNYSATELSKQLDTLEAIGDLIFSNNTIQEQLVIYQSSSTNSEKSSSRTKIYNLLYDYIYNFDNSNIEYITFYQDSEVASSSSFISSQLPPDLIDTLIGRAKSANGSSIWVTDYCDSEGLFLVKDVRQINRLSLESLGVMIINVNLEQLIDSTAVFQTNYEDVSYLLIDNGRVLYENTPDPYSDIDSMKAQFSERYSVISLADRDYFAVHGTVPGCGWDYLCAVLYNPIIETIEVTRNVSMAVITSCIILIIGLSTNIITSLTKHFDFLLKKMKLFGEGTYQILESEYDYSIRHDEIGTLHINFDAMANKVNTLIHKNYIEELLKKEAQIKALESQIDPHFLYNTLDAINWRAKAIGAADISQITKALGNLLRISLKKIDNHYTLQMELDALDSYIVIQKLRHQNRLEYTVSMDDSLLPCEIPKLTLQPLVENAVRYGLEEISETCYISIDIACVGNQLVIEVKNNGSRFPENLIERLNTGEVLPHGFGIGLLNIHKRIQMTYGLEYGLYLYNLEDEETDEEYAVTRVTLPIITD
ncbi:MAG: cache domain-containing sensor histidine kinase [Lachnospiraceae bacterium]